MKKDIPIQKVEELAIAIIPREENGIVDEELWDVFIVNLKKEPIQNVLVNSKGYGELEGEPMRTTVMRHYFEKISAHQAIHVEPIQTKLFSIANEFWVSFNYKNYMYDKKYIFVRGSISEDNFTTIPFMDKKGIMIK